MTGRKRKLLSVGKAAFSVGLMVLLYRRIDPAQLREILADFRFALLLPLFALLFFNTFISSVKWHILLRADGLDIPLRSLVGSYLVGSFFNVFLPSNIGGDAYRILDVSRRTMKPVNTFASVFVDRLSGFCALSIMGFLFPLAGYGILRDNQALVLPLIVFAGIALMIAALYQQTLLRRLLHLFAVNRLPRVMALIDEFLRSVTAYKRKPGVIPRIMGVSFAFQFTVIVCVYLIATAIGLTIPFVYFCIFVPLVLLMEAIPLSIYGLGLRDAGYVFFFSQIGRPVEAALSMSLLYVTITLIYASFGGIVFAMRNRK